MVKATGLAALPERYKGVVSSTTEIQAIRKKFTAGIVAWIEELGKRKLKKILVNCLCMY